MIVHKILALLALLSSLTGCAGADALSPAGENPAVPYSEPAAPVIAEADVPSAEGGRADDARTMFPTESSLTDTRDAVPGIREAVPNATEAAPPAANSGTDSASAETPAQAPADGSVTADTTALYSLFSPYSGETLQPRDDYGHLLPYVGGTGKEGVSLWGLATDDGQVVTDPAYASIQSFGPFFLLYKAVEESENAEMGMSLCGKDGSWAIDAGNIHHCILLDGVGMAAALADGSVIILAADGVITHTFPRVQLEKYLGRGYSWDDDDCREVVYAGGPVAICRWDENSPYGNGTAYDCFINPVTGDITGDPPDGFAPEDGFGEPEEEPSFPGYSLDRMEDITTGTVYYWGERDGVSDLLDSRGNVLMADFFTPGSGGLWEPVIGSGLAGTVKDGAFQFVKISTGDVLFRYPLRG